MSAGVLNSQPCKRIMTIVYFYPTIRLPGTPQTICHRVPLKFNVKLLSPHRVANLFFTIKIVNSFSITKLPILIHADKLLKSMVNKCFVFFLYSIEKHFTIVLNFKRAEILNTNKSVITIELKKNIF